MEHTHPNRRVGAWLRVFLGLCGVAALVAAWHFTGLRELDSAERVAARLATLRETPLAPLYVTVAFVLGALACMPLSVLMAATVLALGPELGLPCAYAGSLAGATLGYGAGKWFAHAPLASLSAPRFQALRTGLTTRGFRSTVLARLLPVGNFTVINAIAGSLGVPFGRFLLGNAVGLLPWLVAMGLFAHSLERVLR